MSTAGKLWIGFGLLLILLVGTVLFFAHRLAAIDQALITIMAVQEPATAATYEMSFNVISTGSAVLNYLSTGDRQHRTRFDDNVAEFERLKVRYARIARSRVSRELGRLIGETHLRFHSLGDSLMDLSDRERARYASFVRGSDELTALINEDIQANLSGRGRDGQKKVSEAATLEAEVAGVGAAVGHYLNAPSGTDREKIAASRDRYREALSRLQELHLSDRERELVAASDSEFTEILGRANDVLVLQDALETHKQRFVALGTEVEKLLDEGIHSLARIDLVEAQRSAQQAIHTSLIAVLVLLIAGTLIGVGTAVPTARSIVRSDEALRERMAELAAADRRKDEFLGILGHELRNPLAPLSNAIEILATRDPDLPEQVRRTHAMMKRQVANITRLVDDLLDVSRINLGKITLQREPVNLAALVQEVAQDQEPFVNARAHELKLVLPREPLMVDGDPARLAQVIANLLNNAVKYTPEGGHIEIAVGAEGNHAVVRVRDDGVGIPREMIGRIFEPFTQVDAGAQVHGGLGVGLSLVRRLAAMHGGSVRAESRGSGLGSTFTLTLPRLKAQRIRAARTKRADVAEETNPTPSGAPLHVLVVDDNRDAASTLAELLTLWGHDVRALHDGASALEAAAARRPDLMLLDIGLPDLDGLEIARRLRARPEFAGVVMIALTGLSQEVDLRRTAEAGFDHHLTKPVSPERLRTLIEGSVRVSTPAPKRV